MVPAANAYCERLGIAVPSFDALCAHAEASTYALLLVALLERGRPMTLDEVALRFEAAGFAGADEAYRSLRRCRPGRAPIYRDGALYALDPHDPELELWVVRLELRPPRVARPAPAPLPPLPLLTQPLSVADLDAAWKNDAPISGWSAQRVALAVLDAHQRPMRPDEVIAFVSARTRWHKLLSSPMPFRRTGAAVAIGEDGAWSIVPGAPELVMARHAVRDAIVRAARRPIRPTPEQMEAARRAADQRRAAHAAELAALRRVILHAFPAAAPRAVVLVDVADRRLTTLVDSELARLGELLRPYDVLCGVDIRATLRALGVATADRCLADLGPPRKSIVFSRRGRTLKITTAMLVQGSCGISRPLGEPSQLRAYLAKGQLDRLARQLESDAKSLYALHQFGRLHGCVRLRWGTLDEGFPVPWHHHDEPTLHTLKREAHSLSKCLVAVVGSVPDWDAPWSRACRLAVVGRQGAYDLLLFDESGACVDDRDVQLARLESAPH
jgi:hypothetical protein